MATARQETEGRRDVVVVAKGQGGKRAQRRAGRAMREAAGSTGGVDPDAAINAEVDGVDGVEALCKARY